MRETLNTAGIEHGNKFEQVLMSHYSGLGQEVGEEAVGLKYQRKPCFFSVILQIL